MERIGFAGGWAEGLPHQTAQHIGEAIAPVLVVLHDTAGRLEKGNAAAYLARNDAKVSVHFVVERDGSIVQQVPIDRRANHAGRSSYHGREGCNGFSLGIEIVNPGRLTALTFGRARAWWGELFDDATGAIHPTPEAFLASHGPGYWMDYTPAQIDAVLRLLGSLFAAVPTLRDIRAHWYVSLGRKVDVNPFFPLEAVRGRILGRDDPADGDAEAASSPVPQDRAVWIDAPGDHVNLRRWPSFNPNVIGSIPDRTMVPVLRDGVFAGRRWLQVLYAGQAGWIVARYSHEAAPAAPPVRLPSTFGPAAAPVTS